MTDPLLCTRCNDEGHLIRVAPGRLAALHLTRHDHPFRLHRRQYKANVRLARDAAVSAVPAVGVPQPHREVPDTRRGHASDPGTSHRPALAPRASSERRVSPTTPMPVPLQPSSGGRARRAGVPLSRSVSPSTGRSRPAAGASAE